MENKNVIQKSKTITIFLLGLGLSELHAQEATLASGGNATGSGGSVSYSVGQVVYTTNIGTTGSVAQGVQQAYINRISRAEGKSPLNAPNIFTPNNDGINDNWLVKKDAEMDILIYNRWGIMIYEQRGKQISWDGRTTSGEMCTDGVYYYIMQTTGAKNIDYNLKGFIQLMK